MRLPFACILLVAAPETSIGHAQSAAVLPAPRYPATRTVGAVGDYHGTRVPDSHRWLETRADPEVRAWAAAQTALALPYLRENDVRPWILGRTAELDAFWREPPASGDEQEPRARPPVDPASLAPGESLDDIRVSPDGRFAAYTVARDGSEWLEARIRRLADGTDLDERLEGLHGSDLHWTHDGRGFFYGRAMVPPPGERSAIRGGGVHYHVLGTPPSRDRPILTTGATVTDVALEHELSPDGRFLFVSEGSGAWVDDLGWMDSRLHVLDLGDPMRPAIDGSLVPLSDTRDAAYRVVATRGDSLYLFTDRGAPTRRLVVFAVGTPGLVHWREVVPASDDVIDQVQFIDDRLIVRYVRHVQHGVRVHERDGRLVRELPIPPMTMILGIRSASPDQLVIEALEGFEPTRRRYDVATGAVTAERDRKAVSPATPYEIRQVWYPSKDGVRVPMFLAHRRGLVPDGTHPTVLRGYGASASIELPGFGTGSIALLELGFVLAAPSLRGGGEFGRTWYEAATLGRKQTTFDDFIAAAEFLVRERYTRPERLAIVGGSNGGLLVTSVINQRPELFRVAVAHVPVTDLLRFDAGQYGTQHGSTRNPAHIPFLRAHSALHNVRPGTCYPATLITTAFNDDRVPAWHAFKQAAALQAAQSCGRPILLRADTTGGHGGIGLAGHGDTFGFIATQLGVQRPRSTRP